MFTPDTVVRIRREELLELGDEFVATRALLARLSADLKTVANRAQQ